MVPALHGSCGIGAKVHSLQPLLLTVTGRSHES